ncbi:MAG: hypothetical protein AB1545_03300 [Thermodesulfobacteriota bacterium]
MTIKKEVVMRCSGCREFFAPSRGNQYETVRQGEKKLPPICGLPRWRKLYPYPGKSLAFKPENQVMFSGARVSRTD